MTKLTFSHSDNEHQHTYSAASANPMRNSCGSINTPDSLFFAIMNNSSSDPGYSSSDISKENVVPNSAPKNFLDSRTTMFYPKRLSTDPTPGMLNYQEQEPTEQQIDEEKNDDSHIPSTYACSYT